MTNEVWLEKSVAEVCLNCERPSGACSLTGCPKYREAVNRVRAERRKRRIELAVDQYKRETGEYFL